MAEDGINSFERELTCAICTEILYQPLTLLDCLHTFCGACLKEWFLWQATSARTARRTITSPYTCPSCRESVKGARADWRLTTMLEGYFKANPGKVKSEEEKEEMRTHYTPGENVLPPVEAVQDEGDSEDERLLAEVREMSMADLDGNGRRRAARAGGRHGTDNEQRSRRRQQAELTESRLRQHDAAAPHIEHQPSLRSLLSVSEGDPADVQAEILQSILADGLLDGIDIDNLTAEQEEELTERIADAYRRRQSRHANRSHRQREDRSPGSTTAVLESPRRAPAQASPSQEPQIRSRPPVSRPHLFEQNLQDPTRQGRRSASSTSRQSNRSATRSDGPSPGTRSATDLSLQPSSDNAQRESRSRMSSTGRSVTDPNAGTNAQPRHHRRTSSNNARLETSSNRPSSSGTNVRQEQRQQTMPVNHSTPSLAIPSQTVRPAISNSAFAPELLTDTPSMDDIPSITCDRCSKPNIQHDLHYNCPWCLNGAFNLCLQCYRGGKGCNHWFGFGFRAYERWYRNAPSQGYPTGSDRPHTLIPRRYLKSEESTSQSRQPLGDSRSQLQEGAFCESCFNFSNDCYWYCNICLEGAWGFCTTCVRRGKHCTHPLLAVAHLNTIHSGNRDPTKMAFVGLPHLRQDSYVPVPVTRSCVICTRPVPPNSTRYHCYNCNGGDYDVCNDCYRGLVAQGKISQANGPLGWRRCLQSHRMAVIGYQDTMDGGHLRMTVREPVGGWALKEDEVSANSQLPPDGGAGGRCLAIYNYFPRDDITDELAFPKNAEIREVADVPGTGDWYWGVYAGMVNLVPSNHVRKL